MTRVALLFMYEIWRTPRRVRESDQRRNVAFVLNGCVFAGMSWRAPR